MNDYIFESCVFILRSDKDRRKCSLSLRSLSNMQIYVFSIVWCEWTPNLNRFLTRSHRFPIAQTISFSLPVPINSPQSKTRCFRSKGQFTVIDRREITSLLSHAFLGHVLCGRFYEYYVRFLCSFQAKCESSTDYS